MFVATMTICRGKLFFICFFLVSQGLLVTIVAQGLVPKVPYFWTSNGQIVVLKVPNTQIDISTKRRSTTKLISDHN